MINLTPEQWQSLTDEEFNLLMEKGIVPDRILQLVEQGNQTVQPQAVQPGPAQPGFPMETPVDLFDANQDIEPASSFGRQNYSPSQASTGRQNYTPQQSSYGRQNQPVVIPPNPQAPMYSEPDPNVEQFYNRSVAPQAPQFEDLDIASLSGYDPNAPQTEPFAFKETLIPQAQEALRNAQPNTSVQPGPGMPGFQDPVQEDKRLEAFLGGWGRAPGGTIDLFTKGATEYINAPYRFMTGENAIPQGFDLAGKTDKLLGTDDAIAQHPYYALAGELTSPIPYGGVVGAVTKGPKLLGGARAIPETTHDQITDLFDIDAYNASLPRQPIINRGDQPNPFGEFASEPSNVGGVTGEGFVSPRTNITPKIDGFGSEPSNVGGVFNPFEPAPPPFMPVREVPFNPVTEVVDVPTINPQTTFGPTVNAAEEAAKLRRTFGVGDEYLTGGNFTGPGRTMDIDPSPFPPQRSDNYRYGKMLEKYDNDMELKNRRKGFQDDVDLFRDRQSDVEFNFADDLDTRLTNLKTRKSNLDADQKRMDEMELDKIFSKQDDDIDLFKSESDPYNPDTMTKAERKRARKIIKKAKKELRGE